MNSLWDPTPGHRWWVDDLDGEPCQGPLHLNELLCELCDEYLVCCYVRETWVERSSLLCNHCTALALSGHNILWSIDTIHGLPF